MANDFKAKLLVEIEQRFGRISRLPGSQSLIELKNGIRVYLRYSKLHGKGVAFFGLRRVDLNSLDGHPSYLCFFTDREPPLFIPYGDFEAAIRQSPLASDGQYKVQIAYGSSTKELYLPRVGHFNMDAFGCLEALPTEGTTSHAIASNLSHWQVQTLLGGIGTLKGYSVYVPPNNIELLDWTLVRRFQPIAALPAYVVERARFASEIDVIWVDHKQDAIAAAFEVEHSTTIYSGLLRFFNDVLLTCAGAGRYFVASDESRRDLFVRQLQRPTFQRSGLSELASFLDYSNVFDWHHRLSNSSQPGK
jgi:hypothetical protein